MERNVLFATTADILGCTPAAVKEFCMGGESSALDVVTPEDLAAQIRECEGK